MLTEKLVCPKLVDEKSPLNNPYIFVVGHDVFMCVCVCFCFYLLLLFLFLLFLLFVCLICFFPNLYLEQKSFATGSSLAVAGTQTITVKLGCTY